MPEYLQNNPRIRPEYSQKIPRVFPELSQNIARILPEYSENNPKHREKNAGKPFWKIYKKSLEDQRKIDEKSMTIRRKSSLEVCWALLGPVGVPYWRP